MAGEFFRTNTARECRLNDVSFTMRKHLLLRIEPFPTLCTLDFLVVFEVADFLATRLLGMIIGDRMMLLLLLIMMVDIMQGTYNGIFIAAVIVGGQLQFSRSSPHMNLNFIAVKLNKKKEQKLSK